MAQGLIALGVMALGGRVHRGPQPVGQMNSFAENETCCLTTVLMQIGQMCSQPLS